MKVFIYLLGLVLLVCSCEKEPVEYNKSNISLPDSGDIGPTLSINGEWLLISGRMYLKEMEGNYESSKYDHFDANKSNSSMRYGGSLCRIEDLYGDSTIWDFNINEYGGGVFILDRDSSSKYNIQAGSYGSWRITENMNMNIPQKMGGSAKPFTAHINDFDNQIIDVIINEMSTGIDGINYTYHNVLQFKKL